MKNMVIYKFKVTDKRQKITLKNGAKPLCLKKQYDDDDTVCLWVEVDINQPDLDYILQGIMTGERHYQHSSLTKYIGTILYDDGDYVLHYFLTPNIPH